MALDQPSGGAHKRRPSFRKTTYSRVQRGQEVAAKWPIKMKASSRKAHAERMEFFRQVQWAWKFTYPAFVQQLTEAVKGTPLLPRDLYLSQLAGRLLGFQTPEGEWIVSVEVQNDVSTTLDFLTSLPGSMLIRGPDGWIGLNPGEVGQILTMVEEEEPPQWVDPAGGGGGGNVILPPPVNGALRYNSSTNISAATSLVLTDCWCLEAREISQLQLPIRGSPSGIYKPVIYDWAAIPSLPAATTGATLVATGPDKSFVNGPSFQSLPFAAPVALTPGRIYLIGYHKRSAAIQTSFATYKDALNAYTSTAVTAAPPNPLPALTITTSAAISYYAE